MTAVLDVLSGLCLLAGSALCFCAALGLVRFPDLFSRQHAATKPQVLGVVLVMIGVGLGLRSGLAIGMLVLVAVFQLVTSPAASHMMSRAALRSGQISLPEDHRQTAATRTGATASRASRGPAAAKGDRES